MSEAKLLTFEKIGINPNGANLMAKYPKFVGSPFSITLNAGENYFIAEFRFNKIVNYPFLRILNDKGDIIQGDTFMSDYPTNLALAPELDGYGLFYFANYDEIRFYELPQGFYNNLNLEWQELTNKFLQREI